MSSVDSRVLMADITAEAAANHEISVLAGATINGYVDELGAAFAQREGLNPASIEAAGANLFSARRGRGSSGSAGSSVAAGSSGAGGDEPWSVREWGSAVSIALGIEHFLTTYVAPLFTGIGSGRPAENEERIEQEQDEFAQCVDDLRETMKNGGQSLDQIVRSTELSSSIFLQLALRVLKTARLTSPLGISSGIIAELVVSALQNAKEVNDDGNACIAEILDELVCQCDEVAEKEPVAPQPTYGGDKANEKEPAAPKFPVAEPLPAPEPSPSAQPVPSAGEDKLNPGADKGAEKNAAMDKQLEADKKITAQEQLKPPVVVHPPEPTVPSNSISTSAASVGSEGGIDLGVDVNVDMDVDVDLSVSGASEIDLEQLSDLKPPPVSLDNVSDMMQGPMGSSGCASLLGALSLITAEFFEGCTTELSCETPAEPGCETPAEPAEKPAPPQPEPESVPAKHTPEVPDPETGVIPPPAELAEVEEPPAPPKKGLIESTNGQSPVTESATTHTAAEPTPSRDKEAPAPEPRSRARKADAF